MDKTLNPRKRSSKYRRARNSSAWQLIGGSDNCIFCPHQASDHLTSSGQPHFYRPATTEERGQFSSDFSLRWYELKNGSRIIAKKIIVGKKAELITAYCKECAKEKDTSQVMCYQRVLAVGELVGFSLEDKG